MIYVISGTRCDHRVFSRLYEFLATLTKNDFVRVGDAIGVDGIVWRYCVSHDIPHIQYKADWKQFGYRAGPLRNNQMIDDMLRKNRGGSLYTFGAENGRNVGSSGIAKYARQKNVEVVSTFLPAKQKCACNF